MNSEVQMKRLLDKIKEKDSLYYFMRVVKKAQDKEFQRVVNGYDNTPRLVYYQDFSRGGGKK